MSKPLEVADIRAIRDALQELCFWSSQLVGGEAAGRAKSLLDRREHPTAADWGAVPTSTETADWTVAVTRQIDGEDVVVFELAEECVTRSPWPEIMTKLENQLVELWNAYDAADSAINALSPETIDTMSAVLENDWICECLTVGLDGKVEAFRGTKPTGGYPVDLAALISSIRNGLRPDEEDCQPLGKWLERLSDLIVVLEPFSGAPD